MDTADVLVENFRPAVKHRLGIGPDTLRERNPRLVYASISGFGQTGPYAERGGVDQVIQGMSGIMSVTGPPGTGPWRVGIAISDTAAGTFLTQGILAALLARERTGRGQWVHTSVLEAAINFLDFQATRWLTDGIVPQQAGNSHPSLGGVGTGTQRTADGYVNFSALGGWAELCVAIGAPELATDPRFGDPADRHERAGELLKILGHIFERRTTDEWVKHFVSLGMPAGPVLRVDEVFDDPQVRHLKLVSTVDHEIDGAVSVLRHPVTMTDTPTSILRGPPAPGADTVELLRGQGYAENEIAALIDSGAAATVSTGTPWSTI